MCPTMYIRLKFRVHNPHTVVVDYAEIHISNFAFEVRETVKAIVIK